MGRVLEGFRGDDSGAVSVEFVLWIPVFVLIIALVTDATMLLQTQTMMINAARDTSRQVVLTSVDQGSAPDYARSLLNDRNYEVEVEDSALNITTTISVPFSEVMVFTTSFTGSNTLSARVSMARE